MATLVDVQTADVAGYLVTIVTIVCFAVSAVCVLAQF